MAKVYLAIGSNVGVGDQQFNRSIELLQKELKDIKQAPRYASKAVGFTDQPDFLNTVVSGETQLSPQELLTFTQSTEKAVGRIKRFHWGPREIDIDIIFYGDQIIEDIGLSIPHPRFSERDFVLKPLQDLDPDLVDPVSKLTARELYEQIPTSSRSIKD